MKTTTSQHGERCLWRRSWSVGIATALLAAAPFVASAQNDGATGGENSTSSYEGVAGLTGQTFDQLKAGITTDYSYKDPSKVYFLYNVGTGKFLNMGGYWGTHASMKDYPMPLWTRNGEPLNGTSSLNFTHNIATTEGNMLKWVNSGRNPTTDVGVFCDRKETEDKNGYDGWFFEEVADNGKNTYHIYTYSTPSAKSEDAKLYLFAHPQGQGTADKNCGADKMENLLAEFPSDKYNQWRVLTLQDLYGLQEENSDDLDGPLDLSYKLKCPGFERGRTDISDWQVYTSSATSESYYRIGLQEYNWKMPTTVSTTATPLSRSKDDDHGEDYNNGNFQKSSDYLYSFPYSGTTAQDIKGRENYLRYMGKFFCMDVHRTHGYIYQKVYVKHPGTYIVECKGYSNTPKALLFAGIGQNDGSGLVEGTKRTTTLNQVSNMPADEQARLHVSELNMDYAGKEFYESSKYTNSVIVQVTEDMINNAGTDGACIAFGIYIGHPDNTNETPDADEWTVFDDFRILYASNTKDEDLILDELRGDLDYLIDGITYKNRTLRLAKTFTPNQWNSFVLPVDLTANQLREAFGGTVRLAKLKTLTETELQFETVNLDENTNKALEAYQPYIIFPIKTMENNDSKSYTARTGDNYEVTIKAQHFEIPNVTFKTTGDNKNDLSHMTQDSKGNYLWTSILSNGDGTIQAYGTFVRTFALEATQDETGVWSFPSGKGEIRPGYDNLVGSYFFDKGKVYYTENPEKVRGLRGFSCWFKPNNNEAPKVYIDGVEQETELTAIGELIVGPEAANRYGKNDGVYNLQGQRVGNTTEGLPSGIYIVNGRKFVVR